VSGAYGRGLGFGQLTGLGLHVFEDVEEAIGPRWGEAGLQASLTPSRANGFLNIFRTMQAQARQLAEPGASSAS
jgi:hypothetical protein